MTCICATLSSGAQAAILDDLISYYSFDESTFNAPPTATFVDSSGNGHDGTTDGRTSGTIVNDSFGNALRLGSGESASLDPSTVFDFSTDSFTASVWIRNSTSSHGQFVTLVGDMNNSDANPTGWNIGISDVASDDPGDYDDITFSLGDGTNLFTLSASDLESGVNTDTDTNQYDHVSLVVDRAANEARLYMADLNSNRTSQEFTLRATVDITGLGSINNANQIFLGQDPDGSNEIQNTVRFDDLTFWDRAVTADELEDIFDAGRFDDEDFETFSFVVPEPRSLSTLLLLGSLYLKRGKRIV